MVTLILCGSTCLAQNMIANGEFDTDVSGWMTFGMPFDWDPSDRHQSMTSGSGRLTNHADGTLHPGTITCIDGVVAGERYDLGGLIRVPTEQLGFGAASFGLKWRSDPGCEGTQTSAGNTRFVNESDHWQPVSWWGIVAPPCTQSAEVGSYNNKSSPGTDAFVSYHDGVYFGIYGVVIFADGFESGGTGFWSNPTS